MNCAKHYDVEIDEAQFSESKINKEKVMVPVICNGYDGFGGVHENLVQNNDEGWCAYTLHNKVIYENTRTRE